MSTTRINSLIPALTDWKCFYETDKYNNYSFAVEDVTYYIKPCFSVSTGKLTGWSLTGFFRLGLRAGYFGLIREQQHNDDYLFTPNRFYTPTFSRADSAAKFVRVMHEKILKGDNLNYYAQYYKG